MEPEVREAITRINTRIDQVEIDIKGVQVSLSKVEDSLSKKIEDMRKEQLLIVKVVIVVTAVFALLGYLGLLESAKKYTDEQIGPDIEQKIKTIKDTESGIKSGLIAAPPLGTILPFAGDLKGLARGWVECDGSTLNESHTSGLKVHEVDPYFWNKKLPNLKGRFPRGLQADETPGMEGGDGKKNTSHAGEHKHAFADHTHPLRGETGSITNEGSEPGKHPYLKQDDHTGFTRELHLVVDEDDPAKDNTEGQHRHVLDTRTQESELRVSDISAPKEHQHEISETQIIPKYTAVYFIIRVK